MEERVVDILASLADKLGTTSELLWGVLIKQAAVDATRLLDAMAEIKETGDIEQIVKMLKDIGFKPQIKSIKSTKP
jgi:hypothetical protein